MKSYLKKTGILLLSILLVLCFSSAAQAASDSRVDILLNKARIKVGDQVTVDIQVKGAPPIYGADVRLEFDPAFLQVVDQEASADGIQVIDGDFIDPQQSFFLQNQVLNDQGAVDYALTLLNPAPEVKGNGRLVRIVFQALQMGQTTLTITQGQYGTRSGEVISAVLGSATLQISDRRPSGSTGSSTDLTVDLSGDLISLPFGVLVPSATAKVAGIGGAGLLAAGLVGRWLKTRRSPRM